MFKRLTCTILACLMLCSCIPLSTLAEELDDQELIEVTVPEESTPEETVPEVTEPEVTVPEVTEPEETVPATIPQEETKPVETQPVESEKEELLSEEISIQTPSANSVIASGSCGEQLTWSLTKENNTVTLTISGNGAMDDYPGTTASPWESRATTVNELIVEEGVTYIGAGAFYNCTKLTTVYLPVSLQQVGAYAFTDCKSVTAVHIQDLTAWCNIIFDNEESTPTNYLHSKALLILKGKILTDLVIPEEITELKDYTFAYVVSLRSVTLHESITRIGAYCFYDCVGLTNFIIPESVTEVGSYAFSRCTGLTDVYVMGGGKQFGSGVFHWANNLTAVHIDNIASWCSNIFEGATLNASSCLYIDGEPLTHIVIPASVGRIPKYCFYEYEHLELVLIEDGVTAIEPYAFANSENLDMVIIPDSVTEIGKAAFEYCSALDYVRLPNGITEIAPNTFFYCRALKSIDIPESVEIINNAAFYYSGLSKVAIPDSVHTICDDAFGNCSSLLAFFWPETPPADVNNGAFYNTNTLFCYPKKTAEYESFTQNKFGNKGTWYCLEDPVEGTVGSCNWTLFDRVLTISGKDSISYSYDVPWKAYRGLVEKVVIEEGVTGIRQHTFEDHIYLTQVELPSTLNSIQNNVFENTGLVEVTIPEGVTSIGQQAFYDCENLTKISLPETLTDMGNLVFQDCTSLQSVVLPASLEDIGYCVFEGCTQLVSVRFKGNMPYFSTGSHIVSTFDDWTGIVLYPADNATWTKAKLKELEEAYTLQDRGGIIFLIPHDGKYAPQVLIEPDYLTGSPLLLWGLDEGIERYEIYRSTSKTGTFTRMASVRQVSWIDESAQIGKTYYYKVKGICDSDPTLNTNFSTVHSITVKCGTPLLAAEWVPSTGKIKFSWSEVPKAKKYEVYRATSYNGKYSKIASVTKATYTDTGASVGKGYYYKVRAIGSNSKAGEYSNIMYGYALLPCPKLTVTLTASGKPQLSWSKVSGAAGYTIGRCLPDDDEFDYLSSTSGTTYTYTDTSATADKEYIYVVQAVGKNETLTSTVSNEVSVATSYARPTITGYTIHDNGKPVIYWGSNSKASGYNIYRSTSSSGTYQFVGTTTGTSYNDTSAAGGVTYYYAVTTLGQISESPKSSSIAANCPCSAPVIQVAAGKTGKPVITWTKVPNAKKYEIWRSSDGTNYTDIATVTGTSYTDSKVTGGKYSYCVVALGSKGIYDSDFSNDGSCYVTCATPNLTAKIDASTGKPALSWGKISGATGYAIYRSENGGEFTQLTTSTATSYADSDTKSDNQYSYKIIALGKEEVTNSPESAIKTVTVTVGKPKIKGAINDHGKPVITWDAVEDAVSYKVYRSTSSSKNYKEVTTITELTYTDASVAAGKTYYYKVMAVGQNSKSAQSAYVKLTGKCDIPALSVKTGSTGKPVLSWNKISGAKKYEIWRSVDGAAFKKLTTTTKTTYTDSKATNGAECIYKVKALGSKSSYNGLFSEELSCYVTCAAPSLTAKVDTATGKPSLSWKKVTGATGYAVYRDGEPLTTTTAVSYLDSDVQIGTKYSYQVVALGKADVFNSAASKAAATTATCGQTKVTGKIGETGKPELTWNEVEGATTYVVYRSTSSSKNFKKIGESETTSYTDTTAKKGTTYYYRVVAVANGMTGAQSSSTGKLKAKK